VGTIIRIALRFLRQVLKRGGRGRVPTPRPPRGPVPPGVRRLPSGRLPANYRYAGRVYDGPQWTPQLARRYPNGVRFTNDGFPDFSPYARNTARFPNGFQGSAADFAAANRQVGLPSTPRGFTWHHHQDTRTMQLIPTDMHEAIRHAGGVAILGR